MQRSGRWKRIAGFLVCALIGAGLVYAAPRIAIPSGYTVGRIMYVSATNTMGESTVTTNSSGNLTVPGNAAVTGTLAVTSTSTFTGAQTFTGDTTHSGDVSIAAAKTLTLGTGGLVPISPKLRIYAGDWVPAATTSGTDTTPADGTQFTSEISIPHNMTLTGVSYLIGSVGGTDRAIAVLYSSAGAVLANSTTASAGTVVGTTATFQRLAFTSTYAAKGPAKYYVAIRINGTTARLRTQVFGDHDAGKQTGLTHATVAAITPPSTFTTAEAPIAMLY